MSEVSITIPGPLRGKQRPRATRTGQIYTPRETTNAEAWVRSCASQQAPGQHFDGPVAVRVWIDVPVAPSWPRKRREAALAGALHPTGRPDIDNVTKLLMDALNGILWRDDAQVVDIAVIKRYAATAQTTLIARAA
jgi:Holliday junction resolvase RusA-like endonuclease